MTGVSNRMAATNTMLGGPFRFLIFVTESSDNPLSDLFDQRGMIL